MHKQGVAITLERINNKCLQRPASYVTEMQERSPFLTQSSCGFPRFGASSCPKGPGSVPSFSAQGGIRGTSCALQGRGSYFSVPLGPSDILSAKNDAKTSLPILSSQK